MPPPIHWGPDPLPKHPEDRHPDLPLPMNDSPKRPFPPDSWPESKDFDVSPKMVGFGAIALLIGLGIWSAIFTVPAESSGVVLRFGKFVNLADPGLHFKLPFGVDRVEVVPIRRQLKQEFGFATDGNTNRWQNSDKTEQQAEKAMVTGDLNAALVEWVIQYRIEDAEKFLFNVRNASATLRDASESIMREVVGDRTVDEVITIGRQEIEVQALVKLEALVQEYDMGLHIDQVQLKDVNPPQEVQDSFNQVNQAQQEKERAINVANGEYNKIIPRAKGEADQAISSAQGYALKRVNEAKGDVAAFNAIMEEYLKAPEVTKRRIYLETMGEVLPAVKSKIILDKNAAGVLPLLNLGESLMKGGK